MIINEEIAVTYLNRQDVNKYCNEWYFGETETAKVTGGNIFTSPNVDDDAYKKVQSVYDAIHATVQNFQPVNVRIWNLLFPSWKKELENTSVDLIVGFPEPNDASVEYDGDGRCHVIFDLVCWAKYIGNCDIAQVARNLLSHELCHVLLHSHLAGLTEVLEGTDYRETLDAITFDEGFAHLLSYEAKDIDTVDWRSKELLTVFDRSREKLKSALAEQDTTKQGQFMYEAVYGNYYDKFACMCGMLYLASLWLEGGDIALKTAMDNGYIDFASKAVGQ
ncbi:MAG: hypothetical protein LUD79_03140 [Oscillospiraceae bacterium]|nr:hypothetical protein [Oscillospiraceae bacterium]